MSHCVPPARRKEIRGSCRCLSYGRSWTGPSIVISPVLETIIHAPSLCNSATTGTWDCTNHKQNVAHIIESQFHSMMFSLNPKFQRLTKQAAKQPAPGNHAQEQCQVREVREGTFPRQYLSCSDSTFSRSNISSTKICFYVIAASCFDSYVYALWDKLQKQIRVQCCGSILMKWHFPRLCRQTQDHWLWKFRGWGVNDPNPHRQSAIPNCSTKKNLSWTLMLANVPIVRHSLRNPTTANFL